MATGRCLEFDAVLTPDGWCAPGFVAWDVAGVLTSAGPERPAGSTAPEKVSGAALPGVPNLHSHAFQRAMAGLGEVRGEGDDSFWTWREAMYDLALAVRPEQVEAIARMAYVEMLEGGFTSVGEFHYLHRDVDGSAYADVGEMAQRVLAAAADAGLGITLLPVLYCHSGVEREGAHAVRGRPAGERQRRFVHDVDAFVGLLERCETLVDAAPLARLGWAPHSLRAVTATEIVAVRSAFDRGPVHIHAAEQVAEVNEVEAATGRRPVQLLIDALGLDERWCVVHATHLDEDEVAGLARSGAVAGLCPTTEASLGDGFFAGPVFLAQGGRFGVGSDSNIRRDAAEELRWLEWGQRLLHRQRNLMVGPDGAPRHLGRSLFDAAVRGGAQALEQPVGVLEAGRRADVVVLDAGHADVLGHGPETLLDGWVFASGPAAVAQVFVGGRQVVVDGRHVGRDAAERSFARAVGELRP